MRGKNNERERDCMDCICPHAGDAGKRLAGLIVAALLLVIVPQGAHGYPPKRDKDVPVPAIMREYFVDSCLRHGVPYTIAYRLISWESGWDETAVNHNPDGSTDLGLMQLNDRYLEDFSLRYNEGKRIDPWMWRVSLEVGLAHLKVLHRATKSWEGAVAAYNMGLTRYRRYKEKDRPFPSGTEALLDHVFR